MIDVSVITINYFDGQATKLLVLQLLKSKNVSFEIIVIDNSCNSKEKKILSSIKNKKVKALFSKENLGCARGYNLGVKTAIGKYVFILNNDTEIKDMSALYKMKKFLDARPAIGILQPKIMSMSKKMYFEYAGAAGGFIDHLGYPFCRGRIFSTVEKDRGQYNDVVDVAWASTCAFFARKNVLIHAGLFDPIYFAYAEEVDMSLKIWKGGKKVVFFPYTEVFHKGESAWKKIRGKKTFLIHRNHLILFFKCFPLHMIITNLPQRIFYEFLSMGYYIQNKSVFHIFAVLLAHVHVIILLPEIIKKRKIFFSRNKQNYGPIFTRSIVLDYFVLKKKKFQDLPRYFFKTGL